MNSINEIIPLLLPVMDALLQLAQRNGKIDRLAHSVHDMQLAIYWFKTAEKGIDQEGQTITVVGDEKANTPVMKSPTLIGTTDGFNYVSNSLKSVTSDVYSFKEQLPLGFTKSHTDEGYNKLMEAYFNVQIAQMYYNEFNRR